MARRAGTARDVQTTLSCGDLQARQQHKAMRGPTASLPVSLPCNDLDTAAMTDPRTVGQTSLQQQLLLLLLPLIVFADCTVARTLFQNPLPQAFEIIDGNIRKANHSRNE